MDVVGVEASDNMPAGIEEQATILTTDEATRDVRELLSILIEASQQDSDKGQQIALGVEGRIHVLGGPEQCFGQFRCVETERNPCAFERGLNSRKANRARIGVGVDEFNSGSRGLSVRDVA